MSRRAPWLDRQLLIAPDAFKGTLRATEVAAAIGRGVEEAAPDRPAPDLCPVADGGEGTMEVLLGALGGETASAEVSDPLGRPIVASFGILGDGATAIVEVAQASGLDRVGPSERDAEAASTAGTGELIVAAAEAGVRTVLVAAAGSASTDAGAGAIAAIERAGGLGDAQLVVLCDVRTPFELAADRFAPQKGADAEAVRRLRTRLISAARRLPRDPRGVPMSGAAGGLAGGLWATFGARLATGCEPPAPSSSARAASIGRRSRARSPPRSPPVLVSRACPRTRSSARMRSIASTRGSSTCR